MSNIIIMYKLTIYLEQKGSLQNCSKLNWLKVEWLKWLKTKLRKVAKYVILIHSNKKPSCRKAMGPNELKSFTLFLDAPHIVIFRMQHLFIYLCIFLMWLKTKLSKEVKEVIFGKLKQYHFHSYLQDNACNF